MPLNNWFKYDAYSNEYFLNNNKVQVHVNNRDIIIANYATANQKNLKQDRSLHFYDITPDLIIVIRDFATDRDVLKNNLCNTSFLKYNIRFIIILI
jgi:hypothetical protein